MIDFSKPVRCVHDPAMFKFEIGGKRYLLTPCRDFMNTKEPHRVTIRELDAQRGRFPSYWEISGVLVKAPRSKFASIGNAFTLEFPNQDTRAEAELLVEKMLEQGVLQVVTPLKEHSC